MINVSQNRSRLVHNAASRICNHVLNPLACFGKLNPIEVDPVRSGRGFHHRNFHSGRRTYALVQRDF